jgi:hypothetical protein
MNAVEQGESTCDADVNVGAYGGSAFTPYT